MLSDNRMASRLVIGKAPSSGDQMVQAKESQTETTLGRLRVQRTVSMSDRLSVPTLVTTKAFRTVFAKALM